MPKLIILLSTTLMIISSCFPGKIADLVILNGKVFTVDDENPVTEALAVKDGRILATGKSEDIKKMIRTGVTVVIDARGRLVLPGFNDAHVHFGPLDPDYIDLRYITDPYVITQKVSEMAAKSNPGEVIRGGHWEHEMFTDKKWPTKELIDHVAPDNPVLLSRADGHSVLVNSYVLRSSGITRKTPDPAGGEIMKDPVTGEPTGILKEKAGNLIKIKEIKAKLAPDQATARTREGYLLALKEARELGVTSVQIPGSADFEIYMKLKDEGLLTCRIDMGKPLTGDTARLEEYILLAKKYPSEGDWIRFGYLKAFIDGTLGSGTALMFEPFNDNPSSSGLAMMSYDEFERMVVTADKYGFQIGVHAIGDKGNNWTLNAFEKAIQINGKRDSRHRDEHAQTLISSDIPRFASLGVIASMQPTHCISDKKFCEKRIGPARSAGAYAWKSLLNAGAMLAFGPTTS